MSYQMLLVDDEVHAIEGVKADLDLNRLGIAGLHTAYNIRQAKEVFERESIDIMLCDIEMPQGSGLELLGWVREHHSHTATIFLTSHADFKYAKEALKLGSLDYLLKPVYADELEEAIRKAQSVIDRNSEMSRNSKFHQLWQKHHSFIIERFWLDLINHSIPSHPAAIREQIERHHIPIADESVFLPILISVHRWNKELKRRDETILEYALKNSAEEMIAGIRASGICFMLDRGMLLVILVLDRGTDWACDPLMEACTRYIESCRRFFYCDLSCYMGCMVEAHEMADMVTRLRARDRNNVAFMNRVYAFDAAEYTERSVQLPGIDTVSSLLKTGTKDNVIREVENFVGDLIRRQEIDADILHQLNQDFVQALYSYLNARGIQARQLFGDEASRRIAETAVRSVADMLGWVRHAVDRAMNQAEAVKQSDTVVETVKRYIALNLDQDLSRETIADQVYLNPDYLSRMFKKETGYSISDYVLLEKMKHAKKLLSQTNVPVSGIASSIGYTNFSHFTKIFKKYVGTGPTEYRSQNRNNHPDV